MNTQAQSVSMIQNNTAQYLATITYRSSYNGKIKSFNIWTRTAQAIRDTYPTMDIIAIQRADNKH